MKNCKLSPPLKSPPISKIQLQLWETRKAEVIDRNALQNHILIASKVPERLALEEERYHLVLSFQFPLQFYRAEVEQAITATDDWRYPSDLEGLQLLIERLCKGGIV